MVHQHADDMAGKDRNLVNIEARPGGGILECGSLEHVGICEMNDEVSIREAGNVGTRFRKAGGDIRQGVCCQCKDIGIAARTDQNLLGSGSTAWRRRYKATPWNRNSAT